MDPKANLLEQLELAQTLVDIDSDELDELNISSAVSIVNDAARLAELVLALDGWLSNGGFVPKRWAR